MKRYFVFLTLTGFMSGQPGVLTQQITVEPGKQAQIAIGISSPAAGDWIDVLTSTPDIVVEVVFPDGRVVKEANIDDADLGRKLLPQGPGQHHIVSLPDKPLAGEYNVRLDGRYAQTGAHVMVAVIRLADIKRVRKHPDTEAALQQIVVVAEKARQRNDTEEELKQLLPGFERALQARSVEWIENFAGLIERAYRDIDQGEKGLDAMKRAAAAIRRIAGPESVAAAEFEFAVAMTYVELERYPEAQTALNEAARKIRKAAGPDSVVLKELLEAQAMLAEMTGDKKLSSDAVREAEAIEERRHRKNDFGFPPDAHIAQLLEQAKAASARKDNAEVDRLIAEVTTAAEKLDLNNPQRAHTWWEAAIVYNSPPVGRPELVSRYLMKSLELSEAALGAKPIADVMQLTLPMVHLLQVGLTMYTLNGSCGQPGRGLDCDALRERRIAVYERALGLNHPVIGGWLGESSQSLYFAAAQDRLKRQNAGVAGDLRDPRLDKALAYGLRQLSIYEQAFGKDDPWLSDTLGKLADVYQAMNDPGTARTLRDRAASLRKAELPVSSEEDLLKYQVRQLRLLLRFDEADDLVETYRTRHPESRLKE
jgi:hypothetical protein